MTQELAERATPQVPDLARTPAAQITAEDVALPRIYTGQFMSGAVQEQLVKAGDIFAAQGGDDPDPNILWKFGSKDPGVLFYVLALRKAKSFSEPGGELELYDFDDPNAPANAWVTYNYLLLVPEFDTDLPCKLLLSRSAKSTAQKINTVLKKQAIAGPSWLNAFRMTTIDRENAKGKFFVSQVKVVDADKKHVEIAEGLATQLAGTPQASYGPSGEEPAI